MSIATEVNGESYLLRTVRSFSQSEGFVEFQISAVSFEEIGRVAGIITSEPGYLQGLESRLPNAPAVTQEVGAEEDRTRYHDSLLRVAAVSVDTLRLTMVPSSEWSEDAYGSDLGILLDGSVGSVAMSVAEDDGYIHLTTGNLTLSVRKRPFGLELRDRSGRVVTRTGGDRRQVAGFPFVPAIGFDSDTTSISFEISPGEKIIGLGEQFGTVVHNGSRFELVANDALGVGTGLVYKPAPVLHSTAGYTVFVNSPGPLQVDVGSNYPSILSLVNERDSLDLFLVGGTDAKQRLTEYTDLTGRMRTPPRWAFGVWMSRCRYRNRAELESAADGMRSHELPCDVLHIDPDWLVLDRLNCDFIWSEEKYPEPKQMMEELLEKGFRVSLWELPYLDTISPLYDEAKESGYLVCSSDGDGVASVDRTFSRDGRPRGLIDFSNPAARQWWQRKNQEMLALGVSVLKCDFGEGLPDNALMHDGSSGRSWRNLYPLWYSRTVSEAMDGYGVEHPLVWSRSGWAGSQRYPAQWGGDPEASFAGLAGSLRGGLGWAVSAPGVWSHDVGGFYGHGPSVELYIRWAQVGCLSPLTRFHGLTPREPWEFGEEATAIIRTFIELRYRLIPYLLSVAGEGERFGWPMLRPLSLEFSKDPTLYGVEHEFLLGGDLLVVATLSDQRPTACVQVILPEGDWCDFWTGEILSGPMSKTVEVPLEQTPIYVRSGTILPMGDVGQSTEFIPDDIWELHLWQPTDRLAVVYDGGFEHRYRFSLDDARYPGGCVLVDEPIKRATKALLHRTDGSVIEVPLVNFRLR